ncbi:MAG: ATP-binding protein [Verrucomicrobia bacterium]|nr:ATP-binding protein [Verrucomicrobiota bacterium]
MKHPEIKLTVKNRIEDLLRVNSIFESFATQHEINGRLRYHLLVSIEEILTNIIKYGFDEQGIHPIHITFRRVDEHIEMEFEDRGREFNPLEIDEPDFETPVEERQLVISYFFVSQKRRPPLPLKPCRLPRPQRGQNDPA